MSTPTKSSKSRPLNSAAEKQVKRAIQGRNIPGEGRRERKIREETEKICRKLKGNLKESIRMENCLSKQCCALIRLMDDPFNAQWEDSKLPWYPNGQPIKSTMVRCFGTTQFTTVANLCTQIFWQPNPSLGDAADGGGSRQVVARSATLNKGIPGCPPCSVANAPGTAATTVGPHCGYVRSGIALANGETFSAIASDTDVCMPWQTENKLGDAAVDAPGSFAYRLVAAGLRIIPVSKEVDLGGWISSSRIPEPSNWGYDNTAKMFGNSTAHYQRGSRTAEITYMRSALDDTFAFPSAQVQPAPNSIQPGRRMQVVFSPPDATTTETFVLAYVAFYEVVGTAANQIGTESFQQPESAGKVTTAIALTTGQQSQVGSKEEIKDAVELINAKESPHLGKLAEGETEHKSFLSKIEDFVDDVAPVAAKVASVVLPFL